MRLGARVVGDAVFAQQQKEYREAAERAFVFGPRVTGRPPEAKAAPQSPEATEQDEGSSRKSAGSLADLQEQIEGEITDELVDTLLAAELARDGEPRKGALRMLLKAEQGRGDAARAEIITELQGALEE